MKTGTLSTLRGLSDIGMCRVRVRVGDDEFVTRITFKTSDPKGKNISPIGDHVHLGVGHEWFLTDEVFVLAVLPWDEEDLEIKSVEPKKL